MDETYFTIWLSLRHPTSLFFCFRQMTGEVGFQLYVHILSAFCKRWTNLFATLWAFYSIIYHQVEVCVGKLKRLLILSLLVDMYCLWQTPHYLVYKRITSLWSLPVFRSCRTAHHYNVLDRGRVVLGWLDYNEYRISINASAWWHEWYTNSTEEFFLERTRQYTWRRSHVRPGEIAAIDASWRDPSECRAVARWRLQPTPQPKGVADPVDRRVFIKANPKEDSQTFRRLTGGGPCAQILDGIDLCETKVVTWYSELCLQDDERNTTDEMVFATQQLRSLSSAELNGRVEQVLVSPPLWHTGIIKERDFFFPER